MTRAGRLLGSLAALIIIFSASSASCSNDPRQDDHRLLSSLALGSLLYECGGRVEASLVLFPGCGPEESFPESALAAGLSFGELSARLSEPDLSASRFHERGQSILDELGALSADEVERAWRHLSADEGFSKLIAHPEDALRQVELAGRNVVANYLLFHLVAIRFAARTGSATVPRAGGLRAALLCEAAAQAYLRCAYFAGHMLVPRGSPVEFLYGSKIAAAHDRFRTSGVFVMNSMGDAWQTFGDDMVFVDPPTFRFILESSQASLREVIVTHCITRKENVACERLLAEVAMAPDAMASVDNWTGTGMHESRLKTLVLGHPLVSGSLELRKRFLPESMTLEEIAARVAVWAGEEAPARYYVDDACSLPALRLLPMPVAATWSEPRPTTVDVENPRFHYPQLHETTLHDADEKQIDVDFLPKRESVPEWLVPGALRERAEADDVVTAGARRSSAPLTSVRFVQDRRPPGSYRGLVFKCGGAALRRNGTWESAVVLGVEYGRLLRWPPAFTGALEARSYLLGDRAADLLYTGGNLRSPKILIGPAVDRVALHLGYVSPRDTPFRDGGAAMGIRLSSRPWRLFFPYGTFAVEADWLWSALPSKRSVWALNLVLH